MKKKLFIRPICFLLAALFSLTTSLIAQDTKSEKIKASYIIALGRVPTSGELSWWQQQGNLSIQDMVNTHKNSISNDPGLRQSVITKAYNDAFGRNPTTGEINFWAKYNQNYTELMKRHMDYLASERGEYENVIRRSYQKVFKRNPTQAEINFWKRNTYSYVILLGCHEEYRRSNRQATVSTSSQFLNSVPLSSSVAAEAKNVAGLSAAGNVISAGSGNVISAGSGNVISAGSGNVISSGGLN